MDKWPSNQVMLFEQVLLLVGCQKRQIVLLEKGHCSSQTTNLIQQYNSSLRAVSYIFAHKKSFFLCWCYESVWRLIRTHHQTICDQLIIGGRQQFSLACLGSSRRIWNLKVPVWGTFTKISVVIVEQDLWEHWNAVLNWKQLAWRRRP